MKLAHSISVSVWTGDTLHYPGRRPTLTSVTVNGLTVPVNVISNYAPVVGLHYWEPYLPCSIDYILAHAAIIHGQPSDAVGHLSDGTLFTNHPTQQVLYQVATNDPGGTNYFLSIESSARPGSAPANTAPPYDSSALTNVPMYVSVQVLPDKSFVDLNFYFLLRLQRRADHSRIGNQAAISTPNCRISRSMRAILKAFPFASHRIFQKLFSCVSRRMATAATMLPTTFCSKAAIRACRVR